MGVRKNRMSMGKFVRDNLATRRLWLHPAYRMARRMWRRQSIRIPKGSE